MAAIVLFAFFCLVLVVVSLNFLGSYEFFVPAASRALPREFRCGLFEHDNGSENLIEALRPRTARAACTD
jgi:hypothetical protein